MRYNPNIPQILLLHGFRGTPQTPTWFPWLKSVLELKKFMVQSPQLPRASSPDCKEWVDFIFGIIPESEFGNTIFVGHSLGGVALLRAMEKTNVPARLTVIIAAPASEVPAGCNKIGSFFKKPFDFEKLRSASKYWMLLYSKNDPYVPLEHGQILAEKLEGKLHVFEDKGHFETKEFPEILTYL